MKIGQCCKRSHAAFDIRVIDHDVTKYFTRIELFVPSKSTVVFVSCPAFVDDKNVETSLYVSHPIMIYCTEITYDTYHHLHFGVSKSRSQHHEVE